MSAKKVGEAWCETSPAINIIARRSGSGRAPLTMREHIPRGMEESAFDGKIPRSDFRFRLCYQRIRSLPSMSRGPALTAL